MRTNRFFLCLLIMLLALVTGARGQAIYTPVDYSTLLTAPFNPSNISTLVSRVRADDLAGSDGAAITTWALTAGTGGTFSGTGTLKTGTNGINNHNVVRFNGTSDKLVAATGGAALSGDFYVAVVIRFNSETVRGTGTFQNYEDAFSWGDTTNARRRSLMRFDPFDPNSPRSLCFVTQQADVRSTGTPGLNTPLLLEATSTNGLVSLYLNGVQLVSPPSTDVNGNIVTILPYTSTALVLGASPGFAEFLEGDIAEAVACSSAAPSLIAGFRAYVTSQYGIGTGQFNVTRLNTLTRGFDASKMTEDGSGNIGIGGGAIAVGSATGTLSVNGVLAASSITKEHQFVMLKGAVDAFDANVMSLRHNNPLGVSGARTVGHERRRARSVWFWQHWADELASKRPGLQRAYFS